ncbi:MAG: hypothetical protein FWC47_04115 [Oscillospiraceae bacterium]|nr:hypothetical protein [Oscillospiraceae bacterium]
MSEKYYSINKAVLQTKDKIILFSIFVISIVSVFTGFYIYTKLMVKQDVDLFKYVDVSFSGISDEASAQIKITDKNDELTYNTEYSLSKSTNISNGDIIILTATPNETYMNSKRYTTKVFTKQYTVSGLSYYVNNKSEIDNSVFATISNAANDSVKNAFLNTYNNASDIKIKNISYFYKNANGANSHLMICSVMEVDFNVKYFFNTITLPNTVYYLRVYSNFLKNSDGSFENFIDTGDFQYDIYYLPFLYSQALSSNGFVEW